MNIDISRGFRVYRNLNKSKPGRNVWSVQGYVAAKGWRVVAHLPHLIGRGCKFVVYESARLRVVSKGHREVHAYAVVSSYTTSGRLAGSTVPVTYNPHRVGYFHPVGDVNTRIESARVVAFTPESNYAHIKGGQS